MPVHQFVTDSHLSEKGLGNYWGYNTIGFFAPHNGYAAGGSRGEQVQEFKTMVRALHAEGIEVILDVVYNQAPCHHEFACIRCPMLQIDPRQRPRLAEIISNLSARITEAEQHGWHGEAQGLRASLTAAQAKLASLDRRDSPDLGIPAIRPGLAAAR
jgi:hypothetical protein